MNKEISTEVLYNNLGMASDEGDEDTVHNKFIRKLLTKFADAVFPKFCHGCGKIGRNICIQCVSTKLQQKYDQLCHVCKLPVGKGLVHAECSNYSYLDGVFVCFAYEDFFSNLLHEAKYNFHLELLHELADLMATKSREFPLPASAVVVPIPLAKSKLRWRGFNQAEVLAQRLALARGMRYAEVLKRNRSTKTQVGTTKAFRLQNLRGAFELQEALAGQDYLLVDDVMTTGSTLEESSRVLKEGGAQRVFALVAARG